MFPTPADVLSPTRFSSRRARAFTLVEVTLALGIAVFCIVVLLGLLPTGLNAVQAGEEETAALQRLSAVLADVRATPLPPPLPSPAPLPPDPSIRYGLKLSGRNADGTPDVAVKEFFLDEEGRATTTANPSSRYRVGYSVLPRSTGENCSRLYLRISWPGVAPADHSRGMSEIFATVNRNS